MKKELTFEEALEKLKELTSQLEEGEFSLDGSIAAYEDCVKLIHFCRKKLDEAESRVVVLSGACEQGEEDEFES